MARRFRRIRWKRLLETAYEKAIVTMINNMKIKLVSPETLHEYYHATMKSIHIGHD